MSFHLCMILTQIIRTCRTKGRTCHHLYKHLLWTTWSRGCSMHRGLRAFAREHARLMSSKDSQQWQRWCINFCPVFPWGTFALQPQLITLLSYHSSKPAHVILPVQGAWHGLQWPQAFAQAPESSCGCHWHRCCAQGQESKRQQRSQPTWAALASQGHARDLTFRRKGSTFPFGFSFGISCLHSAFHPAQDSSWHGVPLEHAVRIWEFLRHPPQNVPSYGRVNLWAKMLHRLPVLKHKQRKKNVK